MTSRRWLAGLGVVSLALGSWILWELFNPRTHDLRRFDGHEVARVETAMWRAPRKYFGRGIGDLLDVAWMSIDRTVAGRQK
jgi:hypothetical protein